MNFTVLKAIFKRDFVNYFSTATGYVFICLFVVLSSLAAFWPPEFFSSNLANLDQLSRWMPLILVVFIPAITMSSWAEERRRGTDELLLTLPASDSDVVIGKYLACVAIFTVSLLFSMGSILLVFSYGLGQPDLGLFCCTYLGYWFVGLAMIAAGMVASFLTSNLTVGFVLGILFCAPQALASFVDGAIGFLENVPGLGAAVETEWVGEFLRGSASSFSAFEGFSDFSRGVVSLSGMLHFLGIVVMMLYISMVLIGRRHWSGGKDGQSLVWHYLARGVALFVLVGGLNTILGNYDAFRYDMTVGKINSLSDQSKQLVENIRDSDTQPIKIDAYVSPEVPREYAAQKRELLSALDELGSIGGSKISVVKHEIENFSPEATRAEETYGIEARPVYTKVRGAMEEKEIFLGVAFNCGLDKIVVPFLDKGLPVEYELVRSITTVAQQERKRVGVLKTDAQVLGAGATGEDSQLVVELKKQYDVVEVDPASPITDTFDVLLAVQPSSLGPEAMDNFVAAVRQGQSTAIFEDPMPIFWRGVVGTDEEKPPAGGMGGMFGGMPQPKGEMKQLWKLLGVELELEPKQSRIMFQRPKRRAGIIYQEYVAYKDGTLPQDPEWVYVDAESTSGAKDATYPFSPESEISSGLRQVLFPFAGAARKNEAPTLTFLPLAVTNTATGMVPASAVEMSIRLEQMGRPQEAEYELQTKRQRSGKTYVLAARITGKPLAVEEAKLDEQSDEEKLRAEAEAAGSEDDVEGDEADAKVAKETAEIDVVLVTDIDCLSNQFFNIRAIGDDEMLPEDLRLQNVTFVLNVLDALANDERYFDLRKRSRDYRTLTRFEEARREAMDDLLKDVENYSKDQKEAETAAQKNYDEKITELRNRSDLAPQVKEQLLAREAERLGRVRDVDKAAARQEFSRKVRQRQREEASNEKRDQDFYKLAALVVPPIPPLLVAVWVFFRRRSSEQEGVSKDRLRYSKPASVSPPSSPASGASAEVASEKQESNPDSQQ